MEESDGSHFPDTDFTRRFESVNETANVDNSTENCYLLHNLFPENSMQKIYVTTHRSEEFDFTGSRIVFK